MYKKKIEILIKGLKNRRKLKEIELNFKYDKLENNIRSNERIIDNLIVKLKSRTDFAPLIESRKEDEAEQRKRIKEKFNKNESEKNLRG